MFQDAGPSPAPAARAGTLDWRLGWHPGFQGPRGDVFAGQSVSTLDRNRSRTHPSVDEIGAVRRKVRGDNMPYHVFTDRTKSRKIAASSPKEAAEKYVRGELLRSKFDGLISVLSSNALGDCVEKMFCITNYKTGAVGEWSKTKPKNRKRSSVTTSGTWTKMVAAGAPGKTVKKIPFEASQAANFEVVIPVQLKVTRRLMRKG